MARRKLMITLRDGSEFDEMELVTHIRNAGRRYIIVGQQIVTLDNHTKPSSLDYWLRQFTNYPDTKQADKILLDQLIETRLFEINEHLQCPDTDRMCKGIQLI